MFGSCQNLSKKTLEREKFSFNYYSKHCVNVNLFDGWTKLSYSIKNDKSDSSHVLNQRKLVQIDTFINLQELFQIILIILFDTTT